MKQYGAFGFGFWYPPIISLDGITYYSKKLLAAV